MRIHPLTAALVAAALLVPTVARAQTLAEVAAKEKERRKAKAAHTFTEEDLRRAGATRPRETAAAVSDPAAPAPEAAAAPKEGKEGAPKAKSADEIRADQEKAWRDRLAKANEDVTRLSGQVETMQRALNDLSQNLYGPSRATQVGRLEDTKTQLAAAQRSVADLQEEGRRSSYR
jgi:hypothetical protein